jgi:hypothetical protein
MVEFRTGSAPMGLQAAACAPGRPDLTGTQGRFPLPPGPPARPNMPRQRPPEPR